MNETSKDLGTLISAEMYSVSYENKKKKQKLNKNTFQQSTDTPYPANENVRGQAPVLSLKSPSDSGCEEDLEGNNGLGSKGPKYGRRLNHKDDKIVEMHLQLTHVKEGTRYSRIKAYISIKTETDTRYMIFMRSALTTAFDETFRSIRKDNDRVLESEATNIYNEYQHKGLFMGRVRYKVVAGNKISKYHRKNLPLSLLSVWIEDGYWHAKFYLLDRDYEFVLDEQITGKQSPFYSAQGTWYDDEDSLTIEEAFGG